MNEQTTLQLAAERALATLQRIHNNGHGSEVLPAQADDHPECSWCANFAAVEESITALKLALQK